MVVTWCGSKQDLYYFIKRLKERNLIEIPQSLTIWTITQAVRTRSKDLSKITQDQQAFIAQKDLAGGKKTMRAYYWHICGQEYDAQHPRD